MKAIVYRNYGAPEVLRQEELTKPVPKEKEVLIKVHVSSVTSGDWKIRKADPFITRLYSGLLSPKNIILGNEVSGEVVETGKYVNRFRKGDKVFGSVKFGAYADYVAVPESSVLAVKPELISFEEAAAVPFGALSVHRANSSLPLQEACNGI